MVLLTPWFVAPWFDPVVGHDPVVGQTDLVCVGRSGHRPGRRQRRCDQIKDASVGTADWPLCTKLDGSVGTADLAASSVDATKLKDGSVGTADLAASSVDATKLKDGTVGTADLAASSVDTTKIKDGTVGTADLANNSVTSAKILNGSIDTADLNAALLARLTRMEARLAALEGAPYSNATFKGTYRCLSVQDWVAGNAVYGQTYANVGLGTVAQQMTADGLGSLTYTDTRRWTGWTWRVGYNATAKAYYLATESEADTSNNPGETKGYSVAADGKLTFSPPPEGSIIHDGWIGLSGDVVILRWVEDWGAGNANTQYELSTCVRTAR